MRFRAYCVVAATQMCAGPQTRVTEEYAQDAGVTAIERWRTHEDGQSESPPNKKKGKIEKERKEAWSARNVEK